MFIKSVRTQWIPLMLPPRRVRCLTLSAQHQLSKIPRFIPVKSTQKKKTHFIWFHISSPPNVRGSPPGEFIHSSSSSFIPYFLVYVNRIKTFWGFEAKSGWSNAVHDQWLGRDLTRLIHVAVSHWMSSRKGDFCVFFFLCFSFFSPLLERVAAACLLSLGMRAGK